jgi:RecA-family ATPase
MKWKNKKRTYIAPGVVSRRAIYNTPVSTVVGLGGSNKPKASKEYLEEVEYNSRKNNLIGSSKKEGLLKKKIDAKRKYLNDLKTKRKNNMLTTAAYKIKRDKVLSDINKLTTKLSSNNKKKDSALTKWAKQKNSALIRWSK